MPSAITSAIDVSAAIMPARLVGYTRNVASDEAEISEFAVVELRKLPYAPVRLPPMTKKSDNLPNKQDNTRTCFGSKYFDLQMSMRREPEANIDLLSHRYLP